MYNFDMVAKEDSAVELVTPTTTFEYKLDVGYLFCYF